MASALRRYVGTIPISERRVELFGRSSESAASVSGRSYPPRQSAAANFSRFAADPRGAARLYQRRPGEVDLAVRLISPSVAACLLWACAAQPVQPVWMKNGASESDFDRDRRACTADLQQRPLRSANQALFDACMSARGWKQTAQAATQPPRNSPSAF